MKKEPKRGRGRPPIQAPKGYVSVAAAAERRGAALGTVYRAIREGVVGSAQVGNDVVVLVSDIPRIPVREPAKNSQRVAVMVRPNIARFHKWQAAAGDMAVSEWLIRMADAASGWNPDD